MASKVGKAEESLNNFFHIVTVNQQFRDIFNEFIETQSVNVKDCFSYLELANILIIPIGDVYI